MKKILLLSFLASLLLNSCTYWIVPQYTSVEKITKIQPGMTMDQVKATLGIPPYEVYHVQSDGSSVLVYNYRQLDRKMVLPSNAKKAADLKATEAAQTNGSAHFKDKAQKIYVLFDKMKVKSMITTEGLNSSEFVLVKNNNLSVISKKEYNSIKKLKRNGGGGTIMILDDESRVINIDLPSDNSGDNTIDQGEPVQKKSSVSASPISKMEHIKKVTKEKAYLKSSPKPKTNDYGLKRLYGGAYVFDEFDLDLFNRVGAGGFVHWHRKKKRRHYWGTELNFRGALPGAGPGEINNIINPSFGLFTGFNAPFQNLGSKGFTIDYGFYIDGYDTRNRYQRTETILFSGLNFGFFFPKWFYQFAFRMGETIYDDYYSSSSYYSSSYDSGFAAFQSSFGFRFGMYF